MATRAHGHFRNIISAESTIGTSSGSSNYHQTKEQLDNYATMTKKPHQEKRKRRQMLLSGSSEIKSSNFSSSDVYETESRRKRVKLESFGESKTEDIGDIIVEENCV